MQAVYGVGLRQRSNLELVVSFFPLAINIYHTTLLYYLAIQPGFKDATKKCVIIISVVAMADDTGEVAP